MMQISVLVRSLKVSVLTASLVFTCRVFHRVGAATTNALSPNVLVFIAGWCSLLTLTLPGPSAGVSGSLDSYCSLKPLCSGMGEVVPARTSLTLLPPSPRTVLSLYCFKVSQCINCRD